MRQSGDRRNAHPGQPSACFHDVISEYSTLLQRIALILFNNDLDIIRRTDIGGIGTDRIAALYDAVLNDGIVTDVNIVQNDRILDHAIVSHICFLKQNRVLYSSVDDGTAGDETVFNQGTRIVFCRRKIIHLGVYIRIFLEEVVAYFRFKKSMLVL